jgi:hypothetical protein
MLNHKIKDKDMKKYKSVFAENKKMQLNESTNRMYKKYFMFQDGNTAGEFAFSTFSLRHLRNSILSLEKIFANDDLTKELIGDAIFDYKIAERDNHYVTDFKDIPMISLNDGNIYVNFKQVSVFIEGNVEVWKDVTISSIMGSVNVTSWKIVYANGDDYV